MQTHLDYKQFIESALKEVSQIALHYFGNVSGAVKAGDNNQVLTEADLAVGQRLIERIKETYSDYNIIDEEAGVIDNGSRYTWVIDPIDGTSNFASGSPLYGIFLGLLEDDVPIAGGMTLPSFDELYVAVKGGGAFCNGQTITVSGEAKLMNSLVAYGVDGHQDEPDVTRKEAVLLADVVLSIRNLRTSNSAFDAAMVAKGVYGGILNNSSKIWDNVAQHIVIEEAGGLYTDFFGRPMDYSNPLSKAERNFTMCAAAPELHAQLQAIIRAHQA